MQPKICSFTLQFTFDTGRDSGAGNHFTPLTAAPPHCCSMYITMNNPSAHPSYSHYYLLSPSTLFFLFLYILLFFAHLVVFLHIFFAHLIVFCTSYCFALFFISLHISLLFLLFLPYVCPCVMLLYIICILIILHCPLSGPDSITFHF